MLRACFLLAASLCAVQAQADLSGSVTAYSDYRYRGYSLSGGRPSAQIGLAYDHDSGWFGGLSSAGVRFGDDTGWELQNTPYLGFARRFDSGLSVEAGASRIVYTASHDYDYNQYFAGLAWRELVGRVHYAGDYYQQGRLAVYAEGELNHPLAAMATLRLHLGVLHAAAFPEVGLGGRANSVDLRAGVDFSLPQLVLGVAWSGGSRRPLFRDSPALYGAGNAVEVTASHPF